MFNPAVRARAPKPEHHTFASHPGHVRRADCVRQLKPVAVHFLDTEPVQRADGRWVPVARPRADQGWMRQELLDRGVVVL